MYRIADNYGSKWVKSMLNWFRTKSMEGIEYDKLIIEATLECGLRRQKLIEMVNEYIETGLLIVKENKIFWVDSNYMPLKTEFKPIENREKPKKRLIEQYNDYLSESLTNGVEPLDMKEWNNQIRKPQMNVENVETTQIEEKETEELENED